jgi:preprotein translocase subunit SecF
MLRNPKQKMFHLVPTNLNIDFLKISRPFVWLSTVAIILSIVGIFTKGLNMGIDFTGGAEVTVQTPHDWNIAKVREVLKAGDIKDPSVVQLGEKSESQYLVKIQAAPSELPTISAKVQQAMEKGAGAGQYQILKADVVGPQAGERLRNSAIFSLFYAAIGILFYITLRFDVRFAPGIVRALALDVIIVLGVWVVMQKEFTLMIVAALLTIAGYSCNDTIVIYDRIREFSKAHPDWGLERVINRSINLNLGRTILTILCTLLVVVSMYFLGGPVLQDFSFALIIGFLVTGISTLFLANPLVLYMEQRRQARAEALKSKPKSASPTKGGSSKGAKGAKVTT